MLNKALITHPMNWVLLFLMSCLIMFAGQLILRQLGIAHPMQSAATVSSLAASSTSAAS
jgi:hypothetical protein